MPKPLLCQVRPESVNECIIQRREQWMSLAYQGQIVSSVKLMWLSYIAAIGVGSSTKPRTFDQYFSSGYIKPMNVSDHDEIHS